MLQNVAEPNENNDKLPVEIEVYLSNSQKIGYFAINAKDLILPILKDYDGNYVEISNDQIIDFYMPKMKVKYEATTNLSKMLNVNTNSKDFNGGIKISVNDGDEKEFKIKFASFDEENNLSAESKDYYFKIDKRKKL